MYAEIGSYLADNGVRFVYTAHKAVEQAVKRGGSFHAEACLSEKIAFECALAASYASKRAACLFSTAGIYEALDPLMSSAYTGAIGGFLIICLQETEEEATPLGLFAKVPLIVARDSMETQQAIRYGYEISEKYETPVLIQVSPDWEEDSGGKKASPPRDEAAGLQQQRSEFRKDPNRWAATPKFRYQLHKELNKKIEKIRAEFEEYPGNRIINGGEGSVGIITYQRRHLDFYAEDGGVLFLSTLYPLPSGMVGSFAEARDSVIILEGTYPVISLQMKDSKNVVAEHVEGLHSGIKKHDETMFGFKVVRDTIGPASSINMAHGIRKTDPEIRILALTFEDFFLHSGMPAFVNVLYNNSSFVLVIMTNRKDDEIKKLLAGFGFANVHTIEKINEVERFADAKELTVLLWKGII